MCLERKVRAHRPRQAEWIETGGQMSPNAVGPDQMVDVVLQQGPVEVQLSRGAVRRGRPFSGGRGEPTVDSVGWRLVGEPLRAGSHSAADEPPADVLPIAKAR